MRPRVLLQKYRAERDELLERIRRALNDDDRVCAAWLWGSLGRGDEDELSDLDVWVVVADGSLEEVAAQRWAYVAQFGTLLVTVEAPQNAPASGAYLLTLYAGDTGPHQVDWYWQARSAVRVPRDVRILLERATLPHSEAGPSFPGVEKRVQRSTVEQVTHAIAFFWAMLPIVAKHIARSPMAERIALIDLVQDALAKVQAFLGVLAPLGGEDIHSVSNPAQGLTLLRVYITSMETMLPSAAAAGVGVPAGAVVPQVRRYLDLVEAKMRLDRTRKTRHLGGT